MSMGQQQQQGPKPAVVQVQRQKTTQAQAQLLDAALEDQMEDDTEIPEGEQLEPPRLEDEGDSDLCLTDKPPVDRFYGGPRLPLRTFAELPFEARPLVCYRIDREFNVHKLDRKRRPRRPPPEKCGEDAIKELALDQGSAPPDPTDDLQSKRRDLIARAVALHLRREGCDLREPGDWCKIPRIDGNQGLIELAQKIDTTLGDPGLRGIGDAVEVLEISKALKSFGRALKNLAVMLPNGDVVAVQALLNKARGKKRATRAAALRLAKSRPSELVGDPWSAREWGRFETVQGQNQAAKDDQEEGDSP